jgi:Zn-dependent protease
VAGGIKIFSVGGVPIRLHWTFFLALPYIAFAMALRFTAFAAHAQASAPTLVLPPIVWGLVLAVLLFVCVLLHELGHVATALAEGARVRGVTLMLLGGVSYIEGMPHTDRTEAKVAIVGPLVSFALAAGAYGLFVVGRTILPADAKFGLYYLAQINVAIGVFNLLPAFPLDGGRVLRSLLGGRFGLARGTTIAATVGKVFAAAMAVVGIVSGNLMLLLISLFLWVGAEAEARSATMREALAGMRVGDFASWRPATLPADASIADAANAMMQSRRGTLLVRDDRGDGDETSGAERLGVITTEQIARMPLAERGHHLVRERARFDLPRVDASEDLNTTLEQLASEATPAALVTYQGRVVGLFTPEEVLESLRLGGLVGARA